MKFVYTICYPDKEEIDVFEKIIDGEEVVKIFSSFDFNTELKKPIEFYSPSLDFIRLSDKSRLIFSGLGERKLKDFQVMYIIPSNTDFTNVFNEKNYLGSTDYTQIVSVSKALELLNCFIRSDDDKLLKPVDGFMHVVVEEKEAAITNREISNPKKVDKYTRPYQFLEPAITVLFKILGTGVVVLFSYFAVLVYLDEGMSLASIICGAFALFMLVVTIKFKIDFDNL